MKIYFCRHGQTTGDIEDRYGGWYDDHLTELGLSQSKGLAEKLVNQSIEAIFSSPLLRAMETAEQISEKLNLSIQEVPELRERNWYGVLSGLVKAEAKEKYPEEVEKLKNFRLAIQGGEGYDEFCERVKTGIDKVTNSNYQTVAVVIHGGVFRNLFREVFKFREVKMIEDCGFMIVDWDGEKFNLEGLFGIEVAE